MNIDYSPTTNGDWFVYYRREINTWQIAIKLPSNYDRFKFNASSFANLHNYRPVRTILSWGLRMQHHTEGMLYLIGQEISGGSTTCSAKGGNLSVGWGMRPRQDKAGGERKVWLRGVWQVSGWHNEGRSVAVALALRYVGTAGRSDHLHPHLTIPNPHLLFLTIDISVIDSGEIVDENINPWNNDQFHLRLKIPN